MRSMPAFMVTVDGGQVPQAPTSSTVTTPVSSLTSLTMMSPPSAWSAASPSTLRRLAVTKAALLATAGVVLAVPTGLIPVWVVRNASSGSNRFVVPWASLGLLVLVLPSLLGLFTLAGSTLLGRFRPVSASTMTAD
jgi:hypothetical protein